MKISILMTTYNRPKFLELSLRSILRQDLSGIDYEIIVLDDGNDGSTPGVIDPLVELGHRVRYVHTGVRTVQRWRNMGFAVNIGIQQASGEIIVLTNSDIYHVGETVQPVVRSVLTNPRNMGTLHDVWDDDGSLVSHLTSDPESPGKESDVVAGLRKRPRPAGWYPANPNMPFFLAIRRRSLVDIGGYDEDFIGSASEDCDLLDRLKAVGHRYIYARPGAEAVHLYHGRRSIHQLQVDPGFAYNISLRKSRAGQIHRNAGRNWGELVDPNTPWNAAPIHLVLWVTGQCNLDCPYCNQRAARVDDPTYEMPEAELDRIIESCKQRGIRFSTIELTGGEPTLWPLFERGIEKLVQSEITDRVTFITNGRDPQRTAEIANRYGLYYLVSRSQATQEQSEIHKRTGVGVAWNEATHRPIPASQVPGSIPGICTQRLDQHGRVVRQMSYIRGTVWYCCMARTNCAILGIDPSPYRCPFGENFDATFRERGTDMELCSVCLCNKLVWDSLGPQGPPTDSTGSDRS